MPHPSEAPHLPLGLTTPLRYRVPSTQRPNNHPRHLRWQTPTAKAAPEPSSPPSSPTSASPSPNSSASSSPVPAPCSPKASTPSPTPVTRHSSSSAAAAPAAHPPPPHPFGYGRERYFWAFVVSLVLFSLGSLFALYEGINKFRHPHDVDSPGIAIAILLLGISFESYALRTAVVAANDLREGASWWSFIRNSKAPELPVILLEDTGAVLGLLTALGAVGMTLLTDNPRWDAAGTITIGVLLGLIAIVLAVEMRSLLLGEAARPSDRQLILDTIEASPDAERLIHIRTQHLGPDELLVAAKIAFPPSMSFAEVATAIDTLEAAIRDRVPAARVIYVEPDVDRNRTPTEA